LLIKRAITSEEPPGGNGTMMRSGRFGQLAARTLPATPRAATAHVDLKSLRRSFMLSPVCLL
jgi:hypothetical protein